MATSIRSNFVTASGVQLRCVRCFGVMAVFLALWQSVHLLRNPWDTHLVEDLSHEDSPILWIDTTTTTTLPPTTIAMAKTSSSSTIASSTFAFIAHAPHYFTPDFPIHKLIQIQNYKDGKGLIVNFHITHHAGTTLCRLARDNGPVPKFACMGGNSTVPSLRPLLAPSLTPWYYKETDYSIQRIRPVFHFIAWEYNVRRLNRSLNHTNWEHPRLVSIIVMRNPMDRLLTDVGRKYVKKGTSQEWWDYAQRINTDNYALRTITSFEGCCTGEDTSDYYLEMAKSYLQRFTFIIDMDCFDESLKVLSSIMGYNNTARRGKRRRSARERIQNHTLYDYLVRRNTKDIALYQWAKERALVKCQRKLGNSRF